MPPVTSPDIRTVNSTSYVDVAGLQFGLARLPGESATVFLDRLYRAAVARRDHSYQGTINELALVLGLAVRPGITISCSDAGADISATIAGLNCTSNLGSVTSALLTLDDDAVWVWRNLSAIVADINGKFGFTATLLIPDAPALQIARQGNVLTVVGEVVTGARGFLDHAGVVVGSERFSNPVPGYTLTSDGDLSFNSDPLTGTTISYQYRVLPYGLVCSEVGAIGLRDPDIATTLVTGGGVSAYQVREALQAVMKEDRSYWAR